jgi:hypothetical protein
MAGILSRVAARTLLALSTLPAFRGASASPERVDAALIHQSEDEFLREMDVQCHAVTRPEYQAQYTGPRTAMGDQITLMAGRRLANGCLTARDETERFVAERTR